MKKKRGYSSQIDYAPASISGFTLDGDDKQPLRNSRVPVKYVLPDEWHRKWEIDHRECAFHLSISLSIVFNYHVAAAV